MKITFTRTEIYETLGPKKGPVFEAGHTYDLPQDQCEKWKSWGAAVDYVESPKPLPASPSPPVATAVKRAESDAVTQKRAEKE